MSIDIRSDTVTKPTKGMLDAIFHAEVGDDVFNEDPSALALEKKGAAIFGKEAALYCPSGTMTNQIAVKMHTNPGDEVLIDQSAHVYNFEGGGIAFNSGASIRVLPGDRGRFTPEDVLQNINPGNVHFAKTAMVTIENTCNKGGGSIYPFELMKSIGDVCKEHNLKYHLDGARIFNALAETGDDPFKVGAIFDSISFCLSKGLGAPVGSLLLGSADFIDEARRIRKKMGGGMRQAGFMAAAGIYALDNHIDRLSEDHIRAKVIEKKLQTLSFIDNILEVQTNIISMTLVEGFTNEMFLKQLAKFDIKASFYSPQNIRMVIHLDFNDKMLEQVIDALDKINQTQKVN